MNGPPVVERRRGLDCRLGRTKASTTAGRPTFLVRPGSWEARTLQQATAGSWNQESEGEEVTAPAVLQRAIRICQPCQQCACAETSPAPLSSDRREATVSRYEDWARHTDSWRWAGGAQVGEGKRTTARTARGAARVLPSGRNILEVIGVCPMSLRTSRRVSREGELNLKELKKKKPVRFGTGNRCNDEKKHLLLLFFVFLYPPTPLHPSPSVGDCCSIGVEGGRV